MTRLLATLTRWYTRRRNHARARRHTDPTLMREQRRLLAIRERVALLGIDGELARRNAHAPVKR